MSRRFSNLQYVTIGILFGTCVFLWARKLNLTKAFADNHHINSIHQVTERENSEQVFDPWAEKLELKEQPLASNVDEPEESEEIPDDTKDTEPEPIYHPKGITIFSDNNKRQTIDKTGDVAEEVASAEVDKLDSPSTTNLSSETELSPPVDSASDLTTTENVLDSREEIDVSTPAKALALQLNSTAHPAETSTGASLSTVHPAESSTAAPSTNTLLLTTENSLTQKSKL